jgi:large subunit ribosomal protein L9
MDIILRADVDNLGRLGETVSVKPGYGRNYLIPQGLAMQASKGNLKLFEQEREKLQARMDALRNDAQSFADKVSALELEIPVRVGENDKLYGSVTTRIIGDAMEEAGLDVDRRKIELDEPIRALGTYEVPIKIHPDVDCAVTVKVVREGGSAGEAEETAAEADDATPYEDVAEPAEVEETTAEPAAEGEPEVEPEA